MRKKTSKYKNGTKYNPVYVDDTEEAFDVARERNRPLYAYAVDMGELVKIFPSGCLELMRNLDNDCEKS